MAKIFIAFFSGVGSNKMPVFYEAFVNKIQKRNHKIMICTHTFFVQNSDTGKLLTEKYCESIKAFDPDLCILFNNNFCDISNLVKCPIVIYEADSILYYSNMNLVADNPARYLFCNTDDTKNVLIRDYGIKSSQIGMSWPFSDVVAEKKQVKDNIVFIGTKFSSLSRGVINAFLSDDPTEKEIFEYKKCMNYIKRDPFVTVESLIKKGMMTSNKVKKYFIKDHLLMDLSTEKRVQVLAAVVDFGLKIYGTPNWANDFFCQSDLNFAYSRTSVTSAQENADVYNSAKIGISIGHLQAVSGFPWRILDIMNSNACLVSDYHKHFDEFFPKQLFPVYNDAYEARDICRSLIQNEEKRVKIVENCQRYAKDNFSFEKVANELTMITGIKI